MKKFKYYRIHIEDLAYISQLPKGFFAAVGNLVDSREMSDSEIKEYWEQRQRIEDLLPIPPFYNDGNSIKAITWFKNTAAGNEITKGLGFYFKILDKHQRKLFITKTNTIPGKIIYEDEYQIGVINSLHSGTNFVTSEFNTSTQ
jgi:hypothetical protein